MHESSREGKPNIIRKKRSGCPEKCRIGEYFAVDKVRGGGG
jgi:hypothetical protein